MSKTHVDVGPDQIDQIDETDETDETDQTDQTELGGAGDPSGGDETTRQRRSTLAWMSSHRRQALAVATVIALVLAALAAYLVREPAAHDLPGGVAVQVGERQLTEDELETRIQALKALYGLEEPTAGDELDTFRRDAAKSAAVSMVLQDAAAERGIVIADKAVDDMLAKLIRERYPDGGRSAFVQALGVMGASEDQVLEELEQQALVARLFDDITATIKVSDADVTTAFNERRADLATPERRRLRNIVVKTRTQATAVRRMLDEGQGFGLVARRYSIDGATRDKSGYLGIAAAADLDRAYGQAAFAARKGDPFGPVKTLSGWHVGLVEDVLPGEAAELDAVAGELREVLETERAVAAWRTWLGGAITDADVTYADDYRPADPDALPETVETTQP